MVLLIHKFVVVRLVVVRLPVKVSCLGSEIWVGSGLMGTGLTEDYTPQAAKQAFDRRSREPNEGQNRHKRVANADATYRCR